MKRNRRLTDLYKRGCEVLIPDPDGGQVRVWLQKLSDVDHATALRKAQAARALPLMYRRDKNSEEWLAAYSEVCDFGDEDVLVEYLVQGEINKLADRYESEFAAEDEWADDGYLQSLRDAWDDGLKYRWAEDADDPEASRVFAELKRFASSVEEAMSAEADMVRRDLQSLDVETLRDKAVDRLLETMGNRAWLREYQRCWLWLGTRYHEDHAKRYFESRSEIDELEEPVLIQLITAYDEMSVDPAEGKGSQPTPDSSPSSDSPEAPAADTSSGPSAPAQ